MEKGADMNVKNDYGHTPLYDAVRYLTGDDRITMMTYLLDHGANIDTRYKSVSIGTVYDKDQSRNRPLLEIAVGNNYLDLVHLVSQASN